MSNNFLYPIVQGEAREIREDKRDKGRKGRKGRERGWELI